MFCNQCGERIADGSVFCNLCGARQGVVVPASGAQPGLPQAAPAPGYPVQSPGSSVAGYPPQAAMPPVQAGPPPMGTPYNPNAPVHPTAAPPLPKDLKCSSCGATLKPSSGVALATCEYCGAVTTMGAGGSVEMFQRHFMLDNRLSNESATETGGKWLNKGLFRRKVAERSELGQVTLRFVPYWVVPTSAVADFEGTKNVTKTVQKGSEVEHEVEAVPVHDRIQLQRNMPFVAVRGYTKYQPEEGFEFELDSKMGFDKEQTGGVEIMDGDVSEQEAKAKAAAFAYRLAEEEANDRVDDLESIRVYPTTYDGELLHVPVWFMQYSHKGKPMFILIDGHSGEVMNGERPLFSLW